jgi:hypothetical protein
VSLAEVMAAFGRYTSDPSPERLAAFLAAFPGWGADPRRVAIYGRHARGYVDTAVEKIYVATRAALPAATWTRLLDDWYATRPARSFELNHAAEGFDELLLTAPDLPAWIPPLARLEWHVFAALAFAPAPAPGPLRPNPGLVPLEHDWRLCGWLARERRDVPPEPGAELALVWRDPRSLLGCWRSAGPRELLALKIAAEGIPPAEAARAGGASEDEVRAVLAQALADGLLCGEL